MIMKGDIAHVVSRCGYVAYRGEVLPIRKPRKKIEPDPDASKYILTIWGIGYKMNDQL